MELLIRVKDTTNPDPVLDLECSKRGDVIAAKPDGWAWGARELDNPDWRIIRVPITPEEARALVEPEAIPKLELGESHVRAYRKRRLALSAAALAAIADEDRSQPIRSAPAALVRSAIATKPRVRDPRIT